MGVRKGLLGGLEGLLGVEVFGGVFGGGGLGFDLGMFENLWGGLL